MENEHIDQQTSTATGAHLEMIRKQMRFAHLYAFFSFLLPYVFFNYFVCSYNESMENNHEALLEFCLPLNNGTRENTDDGLHG